MSASISIRSATLGDVSLLARLNRHVQSVHVEAVPEIFKPSCDDSIAQSLLETLQRDDSRAWIASLDGVAVGYALAILHERDESAYAYARRWMEVDQISVAPEGRRRGIAQALISKVKDEARTLGISSVELQYWVFNDRAREAFLALEFEPRVVRARLSLESPQATDADR